MRNHQQSPLLVKVLAVLESKQWGRGQEAQQRKEVTEVGR